MIVPTSLSIGAFELIASLGSTGSLARCRLRNPREMWTYFERSLVAESGAPGPRGGTSARLSAEPLGCGDRPGRPRPRACGDATRGHAPSATRFEPLIRSWLCLRSRRWVACAAQFDCRRRWRRLSAARRPRASWRCRRQAVPALRARRGREDDEDLAPVSPGPAPSAAVRCAKSGAASISGVPPFGLP